MTKEEIENNYEFKLAMKMLKHEFPWIVGYKIPDNVNDYNLIFVDIIVDPVKVKEEYDWDLLNFAKSGLQRGEEFTSPYISSLFNVEYREGQEVVDDMERLTRSIRKSPAFPKELSLPNDRNIGFGSFIALP